MTVISSLTFKGGPATNRLGVRNKLTVSSGPAGFSSLLTPPSPISALLLTPPLPTPSPPTFPSPLSLWKTTIPSPVPHPNPFHHEQLTVGKLGTLIK